jgi:hypothetical protein
VRKQFKIINPERTGLTANQTTAVLSVLTDGKRVSVINAPTGVGQDAGDDRTRLGLGRGRTAGTRDHALAVRPASAEPAARWLARLEFVRLAGPVQAPVGSAQVRSRAAREEMPAVDGRGTYRFDSAAPGSPAATSDHGFDARRAPRSSGRMRRSAGVIDLTSDIASPITASVHH